MHLQIRFEQPLYGVHSVLWNCQHARWMRLSAMFIFFSLLFWLLPMCELLATNLWLQLNSCFHYLKSLFEHNVFASNWVCFFLAIFLGELCCVLFFFLFALTLATVCVWICVCDRVVYAFSIYNTITVVANRVLDACVYG